MNEPSTKDVIEACAKLMGKDLIWVTGDDEDEPILEEHLCQRESPVWNPMKNSSLCFDLMIAAHMRIHNDEELKTLNVVANHYSATVSFDYGQEAVDLRAAYRQVICLTAFYIWDTHHKSLSKLDSQHREALRYKEDLKNGRS
jgi:hypothetical protein